MKLLSVAVPCYNSQAYMRNCVDSLLEGGDLVEILIVDDGSKDDTGKIADEYAAKYPNIVKAIHQENGGHGEAVNTGIRNATGLYFKVVDSDDWVKEDAYLAILEKLNIGYFFYIGGNDSMDTIGKLADYGQRVGSDIRFMGVPKTIDNDLMVTDHTPGYGSAAKYIGVVMKEIIRDATVYGTKYVTVVEIMGRNAGWLTAAAALAKSDDCEGVDMICLPEVPFNVERFVEKVRVMQEKKPSIVIAVSEGVKLEDGRYVCELADDVHAVDAFGHKALTGTARYLANVVARNLDTKTRCIELSTLQRCAGHLTSRTDITEAYQVGGAAAKAAFEGVTGQMVALKRISNNPYQCTTELHPISEVANLEKKVPLSWMNNNHTQMTEDFLDYARPLIQAELTPLYIAGLPHHIYMKNQK